MFLVLFSFLSYIPTFSSFPGVVDFFQDYIVNPARIFLGYRSILVSSEELCLIDRGVSLINDRFLGSLPMYDGSRVLTFTDFKNNAGGRPGILHLTGKVSPHFSDTAVSFSTPQHVSKNISLFGFSRVDGVGSGNSVFVYKSNSDYMDRTNLLKLSINFHRNSELAYRLATESIINRAVDRHNGLVSVHKSAKDLLFVHNFVSKWPELFKTSLKV